MGPSLKFAAAGAAMAAAVLLLFIFNSKLPDDLGKPTPTPGAVITTTSGNSISVTDTTVVIDFAACATENRRIDAGAGSITLDVVGKQGDKCLMNYDRGEAGSSSATSAACEVPLRTGTVRLPKSATGVDVAVLQAYCSPR
ncbi:MAG TPA: hypothetical protein VI759_02495 [Dehalococcoidia bacterium]|nr:hypothetical protein [Dehalococcoidia bacterium]